MSCKRARASVCGGFTDIEDFVWKPLKNKNGIKCAIVRISLDLDILAPPVLCFLLYLF